MQVRLSTLSYLWFHPTQFLEQMQPLNSKSYLYAIASTTIV